MNARLSPTVFITSQNLEDNPYRIDPSKLGLKIRLEEDLRWGRCDIKTTALIMKKKSTKLGFSSKSFETTEKKNSTKELTGRLISWSPWPPANFKSRYPAFPLVATVLLLIILRWIT